MPALFSETSFDYPLAGNWMGYLQTDTNKGSMPSEDRTPKMGEQARSQTIRSMRSWGADFAPGKGQLGIPVSVRGAPCYYGGQGSWIQPERGLYSTYKIMDLNPSIRIARMMTAFRILSSSWSVAGVDKDTPTAWVDFCQRMVAPLRYEWLKQALRYRSYGWRPFELCWEVRDGRHWIQKIKALRPELTRVIIDRHGNFIGLSQEGDQVRLMVSEYKAFKVTHDGDADDHYGVSCHEAAYDPWVHWQQTRVDQLRLGNKLAGIIPILKYPPGTTMANGTQMSNADVAQMMLDELTQANGVAFQAMEWNKNELMRNPDLVKATSWNLDFYDAGSLGPAQAGMIAVAEYDDKLMMRAWDTPERSASESTAGGSRADSQEHTNSAMSGTEAVDADLANQFTAGPINMTLLSNFGRDSVNKVVVTASPLAERKRAAAAQFLKLLTVDATIRKAIMRGIDTNELVDLVEVPRKGNIEITEEDLEAIGQDSKMSSGSSNPNGSSGVTTGARSASVVGRPKGNIKASNKKTVKGKGKGKRISFKDIRDDVAALYELVKAGDSED